ncbi:YdcF family protein [Nakamurella sp. GG22]
MRTLPRYLGGAVLVTALIVGGVAVRVVQTGSADERAAADAIVVLGAAQYDGEPSAVFRARLDHAAELYREGVAPRILTVGGGRTGDRTTEGAAGADYLAADGIDRSVLLAVGTGDDTLASLRATDELLDDNGWRSVVVVTDPWHAARAAAMATDLGLSVQVSPVQQGPALDSDVRLPYVLRETLGVLYYRLTGGSSGAGTTVM